MSRVTTPLAIIFALTLLGCNGSDEGAQVRRDFPAGAVAGRTAGAAGTVLETMDSGGYTYALVDVDGEEMWTAGPVTPLDVGQEIGFEPTMPMRNFHSSTLDRTFDVVYFVSAFSPAGGSVASGGNGGPASNGSGGKMPPEHPQIGGPANPDGDDQDFTGITPPDGGHTVSEVWAERAALAGKTVKVRGRVVKFLAGIMGSNWIHVQDGTGEAGTHDLTVTTDATVAVGDLVVVEGVLQRDKDFGSGYRYEVIVEKASVTVE